MSAEKGDTWPKVLKHQYETYGPHRRAMRHKRLGIWEVWTWKDYYDQVKSLALGLLSLGMHPGDRVLIIGDNAPEWYVSQLAVQAVGGLSAGLSPDHSSTELKLLASELDPRFALVADQEQVDKLLSVAPAVPRLEKIIYWNYKGLAHYSDPLLLKFKNVQEMGRQKEKEQPGLFEEKVQAGKADDLCAVVFTSGCEGPLPQGTLHTYRSLMAGAEYFLHLDPWLPEDNLLPLPPPVRITEQWLSVGGHLLSGCTLNIAESGETHRRDMKETGPSIVFQSAIEWESQAAGTLARLEDTHALPHAIYRRFLPLGYRRGHNPGILKRFLLSLGEVLLFRPLKRTLGLHHARICYSFGSVVSPQVLHFFSALGLPMKNIYVSSEAGPLCALSGRAQDAESLGPLSEKEGVKIDPTGELLFQRTALFSGYWGSDDRGRLSGSWFSSGDYGRIKENGGVEVLGRRSELILFDNGKIFAPQKIESRLRFSPYIQDAWVWVDGERLTVSAVVAPHYPEVGRWAGRKRIAFSGPEDLYRREEVQKLMGDEIRRVNADSDPCFPIQRFVLLPRPLDPDLGELTRNRKLRRSVLQERFQGLIEGVRQGKEEVVWESPVLTAEEGIRFVQTSLRILAVEEKERP